MTSWYLETNMLVALAYVFFAACAWLLRDRDWSHAAWVRVARATLISAVAAAAVVALAPAPAPYDVATTLWPKPAQAPANVAAAASTPSPPLDVATHAPVAPDASTFGCALLAAAMAWRVTSLTRSGRHVRRLLKGSTVWRSVGRLDIRLARDVLVPFSASGLYRSHVVIPESMLGNATDLRMALRHEGQHHRHGDAAWAIALDVLTVLLPLNPFAVLWRRRLAALHEFACDEAVIGRGRFDSHAYGHCLIRVTEAALAQGQRLVGTASMAAEGRDPGHTQRLLRRRIVMLKGYRQASSGRQAVWPARALALVCGLSTVTAAYAAKGLRPREPLTREQVQTLVDGMDVTPGFQIEVNDKVVDRLNTVVMDAARRQRTRDALDRMNVLKRDLSQALGNYGHPIELLAVPLVESMYQNLPANPRAPHSAGMWQFVPQTARNYGLVVSSAVDQRLDVPMETDAAMRLLGANRLRFQDWLLSLAAYNQGEGTVQTAINRGGTADAWRLIEAGHLNDYVVQITAGAILIGNPELLD